MRDETCAQFHCCFRQEKRKWQTPSFRIARHRNGLIKFSVDNCIQDYCISLWVFACNVPFILLNHSEYIEANTFKIDQTVGIPYIKAKFEANNAFTYSTPIFFVYLAMFVYPIRFGCIIFMPLAQCNCDKSKGILCNAIIHTYVTRGDCTNTKVASVAQSVWIVL